MEHFTQLFNTLDSTNSTNEKVAALVHYFNLVEEEALVWTIAILIGKAPKRMVKTTLLRQWASDVAAIPLWLIEESYYIVGDLAETLANVLPDNEQHINFNLLEVIREVQSLKSKQDEEKEILVKTKWQSLGRSERFVFNKLITGNFRVGVSKQLVIKALAQFSNTESNQIAHQLMGNWVPDLITISDLLQPNSGNITQPYPFFLAYPLEGVPDNLREWQIEKKYDGIRGQIIIREQQLFVWSRGEELITDEFPEFSILTQLLPSGTVLDGEIIPWKNNAPLPFSIMQTRIGRKNLTKSVLAKAPIIMIVFDILEFEGKDIRNLPLIERRNILEALINISILENVLIFSPILEFKDWGEVQHFVSNAREEKCEGVMLKRLSGIYESGRRKGNWWKWKTDPMTIDGVLLYAQSGSGRRANLYTDLTFAVWKENELVPFTKAYSGLTDHEMKELDTWIKRNTIEKFGPVRSVKAMQVFELAFEGIAYSSRHKSGVALRFPRIVRWRKDKAASEANHLKDLIELINYRDNE